MASRPAAHAQPHHTAQAALGVNTSLFSFAFISFNFLSVATTPTIAAAVSAGRRDAAGEVTWQAGAAAAALGVAVSAGLLLYSDQALQVGRAGAAACTAPRRLLRASCRCCAGPAGHPPATRRR